MSHASGGQSTSERLLNGDSAQRAYNARPISEQGFPFAPRDTNGSAMHHRDRLSQGNSFSLREGRTGTEYSNLGDKRRTLEPRIADISSPSASERLRLKQQGVDKWRVGQQNPVYNNQEVHVSPIRPYAAESGSSSPLRKQLARNAVQIAQAKPSIESVGDLFNYNASANMPAKEICNAVQATEMPSWNTLRPFLNGRFLYNSTGQASNEASDIEPIGQFPRPLQDTLIVDDLLNIFLGVDGSYVSAKMIRGIDNVHLVYTLDVDMDISMKEIASKMLPLSEYAVTLERFVETRSAYEWGLVSHAFAGAIREILEDWRLFVTQLEHQHLTTNLKLQGLWYHCQKPMATLQLVGNLAGEAASGQLRGAAILNLLYQKLTTMAGDAEALSTLQRLLATSSKPYFEMLEAWLCEGVLNDPYAEFMIREDKAVAHDSVNEENESAYWTDRYVLRMTRPANLDVSQNIHPEMPKFLEPCRDAVLTTGKYLNIVRECGKEVQRPLPSDTHIVYDERQEFLQLITLANKNASTAMMKLMQNEMDLSAILLALKHYFLIDRGDIIISFLDTAEEEMAKPKQAVSLPRLQTLLDLAVRSSSGVAALKGDELFCTIDSRRLQPMLHDLAPPRGGRKLKTPVVQTPLKGMGESHEDEAFALTTQVGREVFMLGFKVSWPMNLVVSRGAMNTYQLIFRHLFELKCVERELNKVWKIYQKARLIAEDSKGGLKTAFGLCQRMMHFFHQYLLYVTFEILEPHWLILRNAVRDATNLDMIMEHHRKFLQRALSGTVLKSKMVRTLTDLKALVYSFSKESSPLDVVNETSETEPLRKPRLSRSISQTQQRHAKLAIGTEKILAILDDTEYAARISTLDKKFSQSLAAFITGLSDVHRGFCLKPDSNKEEVESLQNLITRLDFNSYYASAQPSFGSAFVLNSMKIRSVS